MNQWLPVMVRCQLDIALDISAILPHLISWLYLVLAAMKLLASQLTAIKLLARELTAIKLLASQLTAIKLLASQL